MAALRGQAWMEREAQRERGQFWTPDWVAEAMVRYARAGGAKEIFDPAVGAGALFRAARRIFGAEVRLGGFELDRGALECARRSGLTSGDLAGVRIADFALTPPAPGIEAIVANPPYIRHHRLAAAAKKKLRLFSARLLGHALDGRAGYHAYFLLRALHLLSPGGRLAFLIPADICEGISAAHLWRWVAQHFCLDAVVTFAPEATPFPGVDTNPLMIMIRRDLPNSELRWVVCRRRGEALSKWVESGFTTGIRGVEVDGRTLVEALGTGLSRPREAGQEESNGFRLGQAARVMRGIATGCNQFFFLTARRAVELDLPPDLLLPAVGRTRDVNGEEVMPADLAHLEAAGRPTLLFAPDGRKLAEFSAPVRRYLWSGERLGLPLRPLISQRRPWYRMEHRQPPPFLFAYLGRRNIRFIRNRAGVVPLTCFLCIYPRLDSSAFLAALWEALRSPETLAGLRAVGKSYGGGAIKVEPRALERLALARRWAEPLRRMLPAVAPVPSQSRLAF